MRRIAVRFSISPVPSEDPIKKQGVPIASGIPTAARPGGFGLVHKGLFR